MSDSGSLPPPSDPDPPSMPAGYVGFVRPPPAPPMSEQELRYEPLVTVSGCLIFIGLLLTLTGCGMLLFIFGFGPIGAPAAALGLGVLVIAFVLRFVARVLQKRP